MFNKFMLWILKKTYKYHKIREIHYYGMAYEAFLWRQDTEDRYFKRYTYHRERCARIDTLVYALEGS
jgi:hypothetical protein